MTWGFPVLETPRRTYLNDQMESHRCRCVSSWGCRVPALYPVTGAQLMAVSITQLCKEMLRLILHSVITAISSGKLSISAWVHMSLVFICSSCCHNIHSLGDFKKQTLISHNSGVWEVQGRDRQIWCLESTHIIVCPFPVTSHGVRRQGVFSVLVCKGTNPIMRLHPPDWRPHLLVPSHLC